MKLIFMILLLISTSLSVAGEDIEVTVHVDDAYKPFSFMHEGRAKGMYIDVLRAAFSKMDGFNVKMKPIPWNRGKKMMETGKQFALTPTFFHAHDWPYLYPYSLPFYTETIIAVCTEKTLKQARPHWPDDYKGLIVGNVAGFDGWGGSKFRALVKQAKIHYIEAQSTDALIQMIPRGHADCIMIENRAFDYEYRRLKSSAAYNENSHSKLIKGAIIGTDPVYIGYSEAAIKSGKHTYAYDFRKAFDAAIYQMNKSGEVEDIMSAYQD